MKFVFSVPSPLIFVNFDLDWPVVENRFRTWCASESFRRIITTGKDESFDAWVEAFGRVLACMGLTLRDLM